MKLRVLAVGIAALVGGASCAQRPAEAMPAAVAARPGRVVIISVDGLRPDAVHESSVTAPNILALARRGAFSWRAETIVPSFTLPSHTSMLTGQPMEVHGIWWNTWEPARGLVHVPTVFSVARAAGRRTVMIVSKAKMQHLQGPAVDEFVYLERGDRAVSEAAATRARRPFDLLFVHLGALDATGHAAGWMTPAYLDAVAEADRAVGRIVAALPAGTTVILTADHGGHGHSHGSAQPQDRRIPWIIAGPTVRPGELRGSIRTMDTAATAAHVLGLRMPAGTAGHVVGAAFAP